jgi:acyl-coenzyme A thioesterase PaaI-like protein
MIDPQYTKVAELAINLVPGIARTGIRVLSLRPRYGRLLMPLTGNTNHIGIMYAGSLFTLGEITGGIIHGVSFDITRFFPIVREVQIRFINPATTDVTVEVEMSEPEAEAIRLEAEANGKADFRLELQLKAADDKVVAEVSGHWQIRRIPESMKGFLTQDDSAPTIAPTGQTSAQDPQSVQTSGSITQR